MVTIKDIAKEAGVTATTVSRALNNEQGVNVNTRNKILQIAKDLNYIPNLAAKRLAVKTVNTIGVVWSKPKGLFFGSFCNELTEQANERGYAVFVSFSDWEDAIQEMQKHLIDKIVLWSPLDKPSLNLVQARESFHGNMLIIGSGEIDRTHFITIDRQQGIYDAVGYLHSQGHRRVAFMGSNTEKLTGYTIGMLDYKMSYNSTYIIHTPNHGLAFDDQALIDCLTADPSERPTAIILDMHGNVFRFIRAIRKLNLRIPEDISLIVYDDVPEMTDIIEVPITTVGPSLESLAAHTLDILSIENKGETTEWSSLTVTPEINPRGSVISLR